MSRIIILSILVLLLGCSSEKDFTKEYKNWPYDSLVTKNLPKYDTLKNYILSSFDDLAYLHRDSVNFSPESWEFTYMYNFDNASNISGYSNDNLPKSILNKVKDVITEIGENKIYGFTIHGDSTLQIFLRNTHLKKYFLDVRERLYWSPRGQKLLHEGFPVKDTMLTPEWQYSVWFDKRSELL